jgi:hypothetical protein
VFGKNSKTPLFDAEAEEFRFTKGTLFNIVTITLLILLLTLHPNCMRAHSHASRAAPSASIRLSPPPTTTGERVRWVFPEDAQYIPICLPAFSPHNCHREEDASAPRPSHDAHSDIYHLVQKPLWEQHKVAVPHSTALGPASCPLSRAHLPPGAEAAGAAAQGD